jgi:hypothetical protein
LNLRRVRLRNTRKTHMQAMGVKIGGACLREKEEKMKF